MRKSLSFSTVLILLSYLFFSFSYKENLDFKRKIAPKPTIIGKWMGKFSTFSNTEAYLDQYWELTSDNKILVYSVSQSSKHFPDYEGVWQLNQNVFKATFTKLNNPNVVFTDSGIVSNTYDRIDGLEQFGANAVAQTKFFMNKQ